MYINLLKQSIIHLNLARMIRRINSPKRYVILGLFFPNQTLKYRSYIDI